MSCRQTKRPARWAAITLAATLGLAYTCTAAALPEDRAQPIHISADKALRDEKQGFTIYEGSVRVQQGTLRIRAAKVTIYHEVDEADRIVAEGNLAHLQQQPEPGAELVHAKAERIEYFRDQGRVLLLKNASIEQDDGSRVAGESIEYFINDQRIIADSAPAKTDGGEGKSDTRVEVTIPASRVNEATGNDAAPAATTQATGQASDTQPHTQQQETDDGATDSE